MKARLAGWTMMLFVGLVFAGCDNKPTYEEKQSAEPPVPAMPGEQSTGMAGDHTPSMSSPEMKTESGALTVVAESAGKAENNEGVNHFKQGHWDTAADGFRKAIAANPDLAIAHYNLALTLDKQGNHTEATEHFRKALEFGQNLPDIKDSAILQAHLSR